MSTCAKQRFFRGFARAERGEVQGRELLKDLRFPTVRIAGRSPCPYTGCAFRTTFLHAFRTAHRISKPSAIESF